MKKILIVVPYFLTGGVETSIVRLIFLLQNKAHFYLVITQKYESEIELISENISIINISMFRKIPILQIFIIKHLSARVDIIINSFDRVTQRILNKIQTAKKYCFVRNNHISMDELYNVNAGIVDGFICNSLSAFYRYQSKGCRAIYIPNSVLIPAPRESDHDVNLIVEDESISIIYVGRIVDDSKGVFDLPTILLRVKNSLPLGKKIRLIIAGDGNDRAQLESLLSASGISYLVTGVLPRERVFELLVKAYCIVIPSRYEGMPNVVLEALSVGCPPVTRRLSGVTDHLLEFGDETLLFDTTTEAAENILNLIRDSDYHEKIRDKCREKAKEFSTDVERANYERIFL
jgi:glycosyltransferase involved in cell wall biosynthesis